MTPRYLRERFARILEIFQSSQPLDEGLLYLRTHPALMAVVYWAGALATGIVAVLYAEMFHNCAEAAQTMMSHHPFIFLITAPFLFWSAWWLVARFSPPAAGSGIPQVMAAIEADPVRAGSWVSLRVSFIKIASSMACLLGGGAIGREGPTVQLAASIFYNLGMPARRVWSQIHHQSLLVAGGAAGIAAAFNTPLGGIVFAIEELSHQHFSKFRTFLITAVIVAGMVAQWLLGPYLFFGGYPKLPPAGVETIPWAITCGLIGGAAGAAFGKVLFLMQRRMAARSMRDRGIFAMSTGLAMALAAILIHPDIIGGGNEWMSQLLLSDHKRVSFGLVLGRFFGPLISSLAGCAGGIFAPSLAAGAAIGGKLAYLARPAYGNLIIVLTMISFLAGVTRAPFTAFVLVLEMTDRHSAIFPMMCSALIASLAAFSIDDKGYYERRCEHYLREAGIEPSAKVTD